MRSRITTLLLLACLTGGSVHSWSRSRFTLPLPMQAIADAGLDALVLKTTRGGRYIHIDCSPDYQIDKVRKKVIARRKRGQKKRIVCIWDTTTGVLVYRMPVEWVAKENIIALGKEDN